MRYVVEELTGDSCMHGALARQREIGHRADRPVAHAIVDSEARPRRELAYGTAADLRLLATALNSALQRSRADV